MQSYEKLFKTPATCNCSEIIKNPLNRFKEDIKLYDKESDEDVDLSLTDTDLEIYKKMKKIKCLKRYYDAFKDKARLMNYKVAGHRTTSNSRS